MNQSSDFTLSGYVDAIRRQKLLILVVIVVCAALGAALAVAKKTQYQATASLAVSDPTASLAAGGDNISSSTPLQLASAAVPQVTRAAVVSGVQARLDETVSSTSELLDRVSVTVDPNSFLVDIIASGATAMSAEQVANTFAKVDASLSDTESRTSFASQAAAVRKQLARMKPTSTQALTTASTLARLENLATVASPLTISGLASGASGPSTGKKVETVAAAALFGLLLGIALATGRDALDRRVRRPEDVTDILDHPIVGSIRHEAMGHAGTSAGAGKDALGPLDDRDMESFRILRQKLNFLAPGGTGKTLMVISAMSQEGKSTVAAGLAASAAESGKRTLLVECDLRRPVMAERQGLRSTPGLTDFLVGEARPEDIVQRVVPTQAGAAAEGSVASLLLPSYSLAHPDAVPAPSGPAQTPGFLACITAGSQVPSPANLLQSDTFREFLASVSEVYDLVILDTPPLLAVADSLEMVPLVSTVLLCIRLRQTTRDQIAAAQSALDRLPSKPTGIVLTDISEADGASYYGYGYGYGYPAKD